MNARLRPQVGPLSREREREVISAAKAGDRAALAELILANRGLIYGMARSYARGRASMLDDLMAEGDLAAMEAVGRFDMSTGCRFMSYALWWVRNYMGNYVRLNQRMVTVGRNKKAEADVSLDHDYGPQHWLKDERGTPASAMEEEELQREVERVTATLDLRELAIMNRRLMDDNEATLDSVGAELGLSRERIRQIEAALVPRLRRALQHVR